MEKTEAESKVRPMWRQVTVRMRGSRFRMTEKEED
jgi:hypothetical protein